MGTGLICNMLFHLVPWIIAVTSVHVPVDPMRDVLLLLAGFLVYVPATVRRLHDTGRSGWWVLLAPVPIADLILLNFTWQAGQVGANRYGDRDRSIETRLTDVMASGYRPAR
jgi:uncharacterized membrane protein YhaH (DUF805 family)